jgi:hypothetical protein
MKETCKAKGKKKNPKDKVPKARPMGSRPAEFPQESWNNKDEPKSHLNVPDVAKYEKRKEKAKAATMSQLKDKEHILNVSNWKCVWSRIVFVATFGGAATRPLLTVGITRVATSGCCDLYTMCSHLWNDEKLCCSCKAILPPFQKKNYDNCLSHPENSKNGLCHSSLYTYPYLHV